MDAVIADSVRLALPAEAGHRRPAAPGLDADPARRRGRTAAWAVASTSPTMTASWEAGDPASAAGPVPGAGGAVGAERVVGFAAVGPCDDPDAEAGEDALVAEFVVDPAAQRQGHGSRLLNACVDTLKADAFVRATWWVRATDDALRGFLTGAGWACRRRPHRGRGRARATQRGQAGPAAHRHRPKVDPPSQGDRGPSRWRAERPSADGNPTFLRGVRADPGQATQAVVEVIHRDRRQRVELVLRERQIERGAGEVELRVGRGITAEVARPPCRRPTPAETAKLNPRAEHRPGVAELQPSGLA